MHDNEFQVVEGVDPLPSPFFSPTCAFAGQMPATNDYQVLFSVLLCPECGGVALAVPDGDKKTMDLANPIFHHVLGLGFMQLMLMKFDLLEAMPSCKHVRVI